jgi:lysophospholipase L1-like esterase
MRAGSHGTWTTLLAAVAVLVVACGAGQASATRVAPGEQVAGAPCRTGSGREVRRLHVLVVGDSIAGGSGAPLGSRWPDTVKATMRAGHPDVDISVTSVARGGSGLDFAEQQVAAADLATVQVVIVLVGINDADEVFSKKTVSAVDYRARYVQLLAKLGGGGRHLIVATFPPSLTDQTQFFESYQTEMASLVRGVAGPDVLDLWTVFHDMGPAKVRALYVDNYHPNVEGQAVLGRLVAANVGAWATIACSPDVSGSVRAESTTTLSSSANPSIVGRRVVFSAQVRTPGGAPPGFVQFQLDGADVGEAQILGVDGRATLSLSDLAGGPHAVRAIYAGSAAYHGSVSAQSVNVSQTVD